jgi:peptide/nickel transport system substrate-binding protein
LAALLLAGAACGRRGQDKGKGPTPPPSPAAAAVARPSPTTAPAPKTLPATPPAPGPTARRGGTLRVHLEAEPPHLHPLQDTLQVIDRVVSGLVYETLLDCRNDTYQPGLADTWDVSADGLRASFHLRPGLRWHDDRPFSPLDVQASFEYLIVRAPGRSAALHAMIADLEGVDILPDRWIRMRLVRPSGLLVRALCEIPILPAEPLRTGGPKQSQLARAPVGTGPFRFAAWERGKRIKLVRSRAPDAPGSPRLDEIVFEIDADPARALTRLRRGEIDLLPRLAEVHYPEQVSQATLRDVLDLYLLSPDRYSFIALNTRRGVLANAAFRHALSLLWDRPRFAAEFHRGLVRPIGAPTFGPAPADPFDRARAGQILERAGFLDSDGDGVRDVGQAPIRLTFLLPAGARTLTAQVRAYALDLRRSGILLDTTTVDSATLLSRLDSGDFDLAALTWEGRRDEDPRLLLSSQGDFEHTGWRPEPFTTLLEAIRVAPLPAARAPLLAQLATLLARERPALFLYRHDVPMLVSRRVSGLAACGDRLDLRSVWLEP